MCEELDSFVISGTAWNHGVVHRSPVVIQALAIYLNADRAPPRETRAKVTDGCHVYSVPCSRYCPKEVVRVSEVLSFESLFHDRPHVFDRR
jgi:hypothetical protein